MSKNTKCLLTTLFATLFSFNVFAVQLQSPKHIPYYGVDFYTTTNQNAALKAELFKILSESHTSKDGHYDSISEKCQNQNDDDCFRFTHLDYTQARTVMFGKMFAKNENGKKFVLDIYCNQKWPIKSDTIPNSRMINTEHSWPKFRFNPDFNYDYQKCDIHHLFPTNTDANGARGHILFGEVDRIDDSRLPDGCNASKIGYITSNIGIKYSADETYFEPQDSVKGDIARALFYFAVRWQREITPVEEFFLRKWHDQDPADDNERRRNDIVFENQKDRNPFIDFPELVNQINDF